MSAYYIFDAFARSEQGRILHFQIAQASPDLNKAVSHARDWLLSRHIANPKMGPENCCLCHSLAELPRELAEQIQRLGYAVVPLEGWPIR